MYFIYRLNRKSIIRLVAIALLIVCLIMLSATGAHAVFMGSSLKKLPIYSVEREEKYVSISFDCAWGTDYTDKLLEIMQAENVYCTFFMVEFWAEKYPEYVKKISEYGHEIGTHSASHPHMSKLNKTAIEKELTTSKNCIEQITGKKVKLFRAPFGEYNDTVIETASSLGLYTIQWDVDSLDWKNYSALKIRQRVLSKVKNGSIVLFHNQGLNTAEALPVIIKDLKAQGYTFVPISKLIYLDDYYIDVNGRQHKNS